MRGTSYLGISAPASRMDFMIEQLSAIYNRMAFFENAQAGNEETVVLAR